jgi:hypothetical protein
MRNSGVSHVRGRPHRLPQTADCDYTRAATTRRRPAFPSPPNYRQLTERRGLHGVAGARESRPVRVANPLLWQRVDLDDLDLAPDQERTAGVVPE